MGDPKATREQLEHCGGGKQDQDQLYGGHPWKVSRPEATDEPAKPYALSRRYCLTYPETAMTRSTLLFALSLAAGGGGVLALESAARVEAQGRNPLLGTREPGLAPAWRNTSWLNADHALTLLELRGRVVLLNFWVFTCYNCTNTVPSLVDFDRKYRDQGLTVVGIHTPEFPPYAGEHDKGNVERALKQYRIAYPNAQDNDSRTWDLYRIRFWPSFVLIDTKGVIRYEGAGEFHLNDGTYARWDERIRKLLAER